MFLAFRSGACEAGGTEARQGHNTGSGGFRAGPALQAEIGAFRLSGAAPEARFVWRFAAGHARQVARHRVGTEVLGVLGGGAHPHALKLYA
jgi:hypothetical protein